MTARPVSECKQMAREMPVRVRPGTTSIIGMKGVKIVWTEEMIQKLRDEFPVRITIDICKEIGVSLRSAIRKARELGLDKAPGFLEERRQEIQRRARNGLKKTSKTGGRFKKGQHACPEHEFKPGHKESEESKRKRVAKLSKTRKELILRERTRLKYGLPQQTKIRLNTKYFIKEYYKTSKA